ncbi:MAG: hypothetical protein GY832_31830 [Chloroflexi bacterium]|nr:hypothetical protein [Chloroflexota bacterium]
MNNLLKTKPIALFTSFLLASILLLVLPLLASGKEASVPMHRPLPDSSVAMNNRGHTPKGIHSATSATASPLAETTVISGSYAGTVAITVPVQLGILDMAFTVEEISGTISGTLSLTRTLVYSPASGLHGVISNTADTTPTFRLASEVFAGFVSGREVQRSFTLVGEVLEEGEILQGTYTETITGFTPQPMVMVGIFMLTRPPYPQDFDALALVNVQTVDKAIWINDSTAVSVTLLNGYMEPVTETTRITLTSSLGSIAPTVADTNDSGVVTATFTAWSTSGDAIITATNGTLTGTTKVEIKDYSAATLALTTTATLLPTDDGQAVVTATVRNQIDQPVSGAVCAFSATLGSMSPVSTTTSVDGIAASTFEAGAMPGLSSITANCGGIIQSVTFQLATPQVSTVTLQVGATILEPGAQTTITATIHDQFYRLMSGELTTFQAVPGHISPSSGSSDGNGQVMAMFTAGSNCGQTTITAVVGSASDAKTIQVCTGNLIYLPLVLRNN